MAIAKFEVPSLRLEIFRSPTGYRLEGARRAQAGLSLFQLDVKDLARALAVFGNLVRDEIGERK